MQYFTTLPKIVYNNPITGNPIAVTDILARASIIPSVLLDPVLYYQYDVQEGDTPEIVAYKYYGDSYLYWIVLFSNQLLDPQWNWPMGYNQFNAYLNDKYPSTDIYSTIQLYQKTIVSYDYTTQQTTTEIVTINESTYDSFMPSQVTYNLPTGLVQVTTTAQAISIYDYELSQNEAKRTINLLNSDYIDEIEKELKNLMSK